MFTYSIMRLDTDHFNEIIEDIKDQYKRGISTCPLFMMELVPEGTPVWDKVTPMCEKFRMFKKELDKEGIPVGILIQASLGHGYPLTPTPFAKYVGLKDGNKQPVHCPFDKDFIEHFKGVVKALAKEKPSAIMLDDDFRMVMRPSFGCACSLHLDALEKKIGKKFTRDTLWEHISTHPQDDPITLAFLDTQRDSLVELTIQLREAIDEIDPTIQGINCTSGDVCDFVVDTCKIFAGKGNPSIVRAANGTYAPESTKGFSTVIRRAATCKAKLKKYGVDHVLAETDTIPFNRYGKNARYLHSQYVASILEGLEGAKHWITRLTAFEPKSGRAYRDILAEHCSLYNKLSTLAKNIKWVGANSMFVVQEYLHFDTNNIWIYHSNNWALKVFERMGIPFYFSNKVGGVTFLEDNITQDMTDEQIESLFTSSVFMTADVASDLIKRGYGKYLGVNVEKWSGPYCHREVYGTFSLTSTPQKNPMKIIPTDSRVEELSHCYRQISGNNMEILSPAVTVMERENGKLSVVYCGTPDVQHTYLEGFAFLNETRREQFISLLNRANALPVYCETDVELCFRAGYIEDGRLLCMAINLGYDPLETLDLHLNFAPSAISLLDKDGNEVPLSFKHIDGDLYSINQKVEPMYPVILLIK